MTGRVRGVNPLGSLIVEADHNHYFKIPASSLALQTGQNSNLVISRRYPPGSETDTVRIDLRTMQMRGNNQIETPLFRDNEVREIQEVNQSTQGLPQSFNGRTTIDGRTVIQQVGFRGCTAAVTSMLIGDHTRNGHHVAPERIQILLQNLKRRNLYSEGTMEADFRQAGLTPIRVPFPQNTSRIESLSQAILTNGPAVVDPNSEIGNHVVIVDSIDMNRGLARLRDPFHGWSITVTTEALSSRITGQSVLQIQTQEAGKSSF